MILPVIALVGQKNVGKSTLFNRLTCTNDALTANCSGLTRDRQYGYLCCKLFTSILIDTGGIDKFCFVNTEEIQQYVCNQTVLAIKEADIILFIVDGRFKETSIDYGIISFLRQLGKDIFIIVNKIDNIYDNKSFILNNGYYRFGIKNVIVMSAMHGYGVSYLLKRIFYHIDKEIQYDCNKNCVLVINQDVVSKKFPLKKILSTSSTIKENYVVLAVVGRPNAGKSTFINSVLGEQRLITYPVPGTTRDSIYTSAMYNGKRYILIDTAGIKKKKIFNNTVVEQITVNKTFKVIKDDAHIILFMIDANIGVSEQDLSVLKRVMNIGVSLIIVVNKWDNVSVSMRPIVKGVIYKRIDFIEFIQVHFISALSRHGFKNLFQSVQTVYNRLINLRSFINTSKLIHIMRMAVMRYPPPLFNNSVKIKLKYIHVGGYNPLILVIHGVHVSKLSHDYQRYLKNFFYKNLNIGSTMLHIWFRDSDYSFENKRLYL